MEEKKLTDDAEIDVGMIERSVELDDTAYVWLLKGSMWKTYKLKEILALIHRLQAENERLKSHMKAKEIADEHVRKMRGTDLRTIAELQKQVDELKEENGKLVTIGNGFALERNNLREELDELKKSGNGVLLTSLYKKQADDHKRGLSVQRAYWEKQVQQAVKDTAQEALEAFICKLVNSRLVSTKDDLYVEMLETKDDLLKEKYGVEVE